jgi:hypothetical protein
MDSFKGTIKEKEEGEINLTSIVVIQNKGNNLKTPQEVSPRILTTSKEKAKEKQKVRKAKARAAVRASNFKATGKKSTKMKNH